MKKLPWFVAALGLLCRVSGLVWGLSQHNIAKSTFEPPTQSFRYGWDTAYWASQIQMSHFRQPPACLGGAQKAMQGNSPELCAVDYWDGVSFSDGTQSTPPRTEDYWFQYQSGWNAEIKFPAAGTYLETH